MTCTNKEKVEVSFNLKKPVNNTMHTFFYYNISEFGGKLEGTLDEGNYRTTVQTMHNTSSLLIFQCWLMVLLFHNILSLMIPIKKVSNVTTSICGKLFSWKGSPNFAANMDYCIIQIDWNIYYCFNIWNANCKILAKFGKEYE